MSARRRAAARGSVVAIGVFDGVHRAHRRIIASAVRQARAMHAASVVLTFWPHPAGRQSLYSLQHRLRMVAELGVSRTVVVRFTRSFAGLSPEAFIRAVLVKRLHARRVYVGENFRFGRQASGTVVTLKQYAARYGYSVRSFAVMKYHGRTISSTAIRTLISAGKLSAARLLLGRPVSVFGTVIKGRALGRVLGFPTANIDPHHEILPPCGVYAVRVCVGRRRVNGMCYIGTRPTFDRSGRRLSIEAHLFDFNGRLYGRDIEIFFVRRIRPDKRFSSADALVKRIRLDCLLAKKLLASS
jgi:riboflavin kinase/FMN adenylyltransferase